MRRFQARPFEKRLDDWLLDTPFFEANKLTRVTREYFAILKSDQTRLAYFKAVKRFIAALPAAGVDDARKITTLHVQEHIDTIGSRKPPTTQQDPHINTRALALSALRGYFGHLEKHGHIRRNPATDAALYLPKPVEGKTEALEPEEVHQILRGIDTSTPVGRRDRALIAFLAFTAVRIGAALAFTHEGFGKDGNLRFTEKGRRAHKLPMPVPLPPYLGPYLEDLPHARAPEPVFRAWDEEVGRFTEEPLPYIDAYLMIVGRAQAAGVTRHVTPHCFRATAITVFLRNGMHPTKVKNYANHARLDTTLLYNRDTEITPEDSLIVAKAFRFPPPGK